MPSSFQEDPDEIVSSISERISDFIQRNREERIMTAHLPGDEPATYPTVDAWDDYLADLVYRADSEVRTYIRRIESHKQELAGLEQKLRDAEKILEGLVSVTTFMNPKSGPTKKVVAPKVISGVTDVE